MDRLLSLLREHSYREGRVRLTSGKESDFFVDCKQTVLLSEGHRLVGEAMLSALSELPEPAGAVAGVELGGCPLASAVSLTSELRGAGLDAIYVRKQAKEHGSARRIEGGSRLPPGTGVAILEDVVTTGGSTLSAVEALREARFRVVGVVALVDRCEGGAEALRDAGVPLHALYTRADFVRPSAS